MDTRLIIDNKLTSASGSATFTRHSPTTGDVVITEDAVRLANDTAYGLSAAVFGRDVSRALNVAMRIDVGHCHVNGSTVQNESQVPLGGTKNSGYGRFDGRAVIDELTELKWITIEPSVQQYRF